MRTLGRGGRRSVNIWPGFVDALATLLLVVVFVLMVFMISQYFLSSALSGRDEALTRLERDINDLAELLALERWDEAGDRLLLLVNFGEAASFDASEQAWLGESALAWRPLLSTAEARFAGPGSDLAGLALRPGAVVDLPPRCAVLWAAEKEA